MSKKNATVCFHDAEVRCEKLIPIYMCLADTPSQDLLDAIFEEANVCELLGLPLDIQAEHEIIELLQRNDKIGFLAEFATPNPMNFKNNGNSWVSGWGYYQKKWFYAEDVEDFEDMAVAWAYEHFEQCKLNELGETNQ